LPPITASEVCINIQGRGLDPLVLQLSGFFRLHAKKVAGNFPFKLEVFDEDLRLGGLASPFRQGKVTPEHESAQGRHHRQG
jgi:hypothetical protein